ncbi:MAG: YHS domain-containing protein, partial [Burkholderiaceae bacterium]
MNRQLDSTETFIDPVCGMTVKPNPEKAVEQDGRTWYFCSTGCVTKFKANPSAYIPKVASATPSAHACCAHDHVASH